LKVDWADYLSRAYDEATIVRVFQRTAIFLNPPYSRKLSMPIGPWIEKCWQEAQKGLTIVGVIPYSPQTEWWREWVEGHELGPANPVYTCRFFAARETRKIPHRVTFLRQDGSVEGNAGGNTAIVVWKPANGIQGPWVPWAPYFDYLDLGLEEPREDPAGE
jgi:hypothetical protein